MKTSIMKLIAVLATSAGLLTSGVAIAKGPSGKGGGGGGGSGGASRSSSSMRSSSSLNAFKLSNGSGNNSSKSLNRATINSNAISGISKKNLQQNNNFKQQNHNTGITGIGLNKKPGNNLTKNFDKKFNGSFNKDFVKKDFNKKDNFNKDFCKKNNNCWWDWCYSKNSCYPYNYGCNYPNYNCYYPSYSCYTPNYCYTPFYTCYDYCTPTYLSPIQSTVVPTNYVSNYSANVTVLANAEATRTTVPVGSVLLVNGQGLGDGIGGARLVIGGAAMPIEVLEWTTAGVTVRVPQIEINSGTPADIEVLRVDGSLAARTAVVLTIANQPIAFGR